ATHTFKPAQGAYDIRHPLPASLDPERAALLGLAGTALQAVHDGHMKVGDHVTVFGLGVVGLFVVQLARTNGARRVDAVDPNANRRALAEAFGAERVFDPKAGDPAAQIKRGSARRGADIAIEASGRYEGLHEAIRCVRVGGTVVAVG